jgi:phosphopantetheinyl transferase
MPLIKEFTPGNYGLAAIWQVTESEIFFTEQTGLVTDIKNEKRRMERLAGRYLLQHLQADFPIHAIAPDPHDKPRINADQYFFSISHSWPYVAAVVDPQDEAGIDVQTWHPRILSIQHKFLSADEQEMFGNDEHMVTLAWAAKEAVYKWMGRRGVDFIEHLPITYLSKGPEYSMTIYATGRKIPMMVSVTGVMAEDYACAYVTGAEEWAIY